MRVYANTKEYLPHANRGDRVIVGAQRDSTFASEIFTKKDVMTVFGIESKTFRFKRYREVRSKSLRSTRHPLAVLDESEFNNLAEPQHEKE